MTAKQKEAARMARRILRDPKLAQELIGFHISVAAACLAVGAREDEEIPAFIRRQGSELQQLRARVADLEKPVDAALAGDHAAK